MSNYKLQVGFFTLLISAVLFLSFQVLKPFFVVLFIAIILRIVFDSFHAKALRFTGGRENIAALISVIGVVIFIIIPFVFVGFFLFDDIRHLYVEIIAGNFDVHFIDRLTSPINVFFQGFVPSFSFDLLFYVRQGLSLALSHIGLIFSSIVNFLFNSFIMLLALFYIFRDGNRLRKYVIFLSPLSDRYDENILNKLSNAVSSVIKGSLLIACIQGILTAVGLFIFGVPNPVLWGAVAAISALIPPFGTAPVIVPSIIFLFWSGMTASAIGLIVWGTVMVGLIDNLLAPHLMTRGLKVHPFLVLLSVLSGLWFFGPIGFLAGPVLITLLITLFEMYPAIVAGEPISSKI